MLCPCGCVLFLCARAGGLHGEGYTAACIVLLRDVVHEGWVSGGVCLGLAWQALLARSFQTNITPPCPRCSLLEDCAGWMEAVEGGMGPCLVGYDPSRRD